MAEIELRGVGRRYGDVAAVDDVSFTIEDGEFFVLVGPSGCGKSTLLNMIVGLERVSSGEILLDGAPVNHLDPRERNMAMVFQSYAIYPHMTVRENMAFPLKLARLPVDEIEYRVNQAAGILELVPLLDYKPHALSGGQRQRVAMGRAIVREPAVFLLDEPLSNLDARLRTQMRTEIARLQRQLGTTTLYVTHDQTEALTLGDRIAVMCDGKIQQIGTPRELYDRPDNVFVAGFIGSPAMNFLPARIAGQRLLFPGDSIDVNGLDVLRGAPDGPLLIGFRPEHLQVLDKSVPVADGLCLKATVAVKEWLGAELFLYFDIPPGEFSEEAWPELSGAEPGGSGAAKLTARVDRGCDVGEDEAVILGVAHDHLHFFDPAVGGRLRGPSAASVT